MKTDLPKIDDLIQFGFKKCGNWIKTPKNFQLNNESIKNVLYAFATNTYVGYIGKTEGALKDRINKAYNKLVYDGISENLLNSIDVIILYKNVEINLVDGLEVPLIKKFKPRWTKQKYGIYHRAADDILKEGI